MNAVTRPAAGIDLPDARGRTALDGAGRDLTGNPDVTARDVELMSLLQWAVLPGPFGRS
ncbi:MAG: uncharacterized protein JWP66_702 [Naasia sp.]|nr:uncharacterized protein [Naasia sp.]